MWPGQRAADLGITTPASSVVSVACAEQRQLECACHPGCNRPAPATTHHVSQVSVLDVLRDGNAFCRCWVPATVLLCWSVLAITVTHAQHTLHMLRMDGPSVPQHRMAQDCNDIIMRTPQVQGLAGGNAGAAVRPGGVQHPGQCHSGRG